jgi:hypothetical protein
MAPLSYFQAAVAVLAQTGQPLTSRQILDTAVSHGLLAPASTTPLKSLDAALYLAARGGHPRVPGVQGGSDADPPRIGALDPLGPRELRKRSTSAL